LLGEAIRLRRLKQTKDDYVTSLNQLQRSDPLELSFGHDKWHDNNGIKLGRKTATPKRGKKDDPQVWTTSVPSANYQRKKNLESEGNYYLNKTYHNWKKVTNYKRLALSKTNK